MMRDDLRQELLSALRGRFGLKDKGSYLREGKCPQCQQKELFISAREPWHIKCGRLNNCGWESDTKDLFPDLFGKISERYPSTTEDPNATADAYMAFVRGLTPSKVRGWYRQGTFRHPHGDRAVATVVFDIRDPKAPGRKVRMERFVDPVTIREPGEDPVIRKQHFGGTYKGLWWAPPKVEIADGQDLWIVEACIDAASLTQEGTPAVATLSADNYPDVMLAELKEKGIRPRLVWALDGDRAGRNATRKHVDQARADGWTCVAATIPQEDGKKTDWNDLHRAKKLTAADLADYRYHGDLLLAPSAMDKALLVWSRFRANSFAFTYGGRTWWYELAPLTMSAMVQKVETEKPNEDKNVIRLEAARRAADVTEIANCTFQALYFQRSELTDDSWYYLRVTFPHGRYEDIKGTFTGAQIATASEFKKRLLAIAPGALFTGGTNQLNWLVKHQLDKIRIVKTVDFVGYAKQHKAWVWPTHAVSGGRLHRLNDEDFFQIGNTSIKSLNTSLDLRLGTQATYREDWLDLVYKTLGPKGIIGVAFWLGTFFAEQIREIHESYPFLEMTGEPDAGKSMLLTTLWKASGRDDYEGIDPNKSSQAAIARNMVQVSNLPVALIESDRSDGDNASSKIRMWDWDALKTNFNGRPYRATGIYNNGNDTKESPFRGSIVICQNAMVNASPAILQRIVHLHFDTSGHTPQGKLLADELSAIKASSLSWFMVKATMAEARVMEIVADRTRFFEAELNKDTTIRVGRIKQNHAQMMALVEALAELTNLPNQVRQETIALLHTCARERQVTTVSDHPVVEQFWDVVDLIGFERLNHGSGDDTVAINLNHVLSVAAQKSYSMPDQLELKRHLRGSKSFKFTEMRTVRSQLGSSAGAQRMTPAARDELKGWEGKTVKCWVFRRPPAGVMR